jgi:hypothetical protein
MKFFRSALSLNDDASEFVRAKGAAVAMRRRRGYGKRAAAGI